MRPVRTRSIGVVVCAAIVVTVAGCSSEGTAAETSTSAGSSSSTPSPEPTYGKAYAFAEVKKVEAKRAALGPLEDLPKDTPWATAGFIKSVNEERAELRKAGVTVKGKIRTTGQHVDKLDRQSKGGWRLTTYECSTSTVRYLKGDKDVTGAATDPSKPLPKGPHDNVHRHRYVSTDKGKTWKVQQSWLIYSDEVKETPCAK